MAASAVVRDTATAPAAIDGEQMVAQRDAPLGGQAVLEGVMMRGIAHWAIAVRKPNREQLEHGGLRAEEAALGEIEVSSFPITSLLRRHRLLRLPIVRGVVALGESLAIGFRALERLRQRPASARRGRGGAPGDLRAASGSGPSSSR